MAPFSAARPRNQPLKRDSSYPHGRAGMSLSDVTQEGWSQGVLFGGLVVLVLFTIANMRRHVLLHRLILLEAGCFRLLHTSGSQLIASSSSLLLDMAHLSSSQIQYTAGELLSPSFLLHCTHTQARYLSCTATLLYVSFFIHNIVSWMKIKRFLPPWGSKLFIGTIFLALPYWVSETFFNFEYFNNMGINSFVLTRPWEAPMRFVSLSWRCWCTQA
jgi:hypothetical protein